MRIDPFSAIEPLERCTESVQLAAAACRAQHGKAVPLNEQSIKLVLVAKHRIQIAMQELLTAEAFIDGYITNHGDAFDPYLTPPGRASTPESSE